MRRTHEPDSKGKEFFLRKLSHDLLPRMALICQFDVGLVPKQALEHWRILVFSDAFLASVAIFCDGQHCISRGSRLS